MPCGNVVKMPLLSQTTLVHSGINGSIPSGPWGSFVCLANQYVFQINGEIPATFCHKIEIGPVFMASDTVTEGGLSHQ